MVQDNKQNLTNLFNVPLESLNPAEPLPAFLEQYKVYVGHLDKLSDRRQTANSFFLTINTGLCAVLGFIFSKNTALDIKPLYLIIPIAGVLLSFFWHRLITSYRQLSTGMFKVLHHMEQYLPLAPYKAEWTALGCGEDQSKYIPLTHVEKWVPRLFIIMYFVLLAYLVPWPELIKSIKQFLELFNHSS